MVTHAMNDFKDSKIFDLVVRMVVPMRREFGRQINVQQFLHDSGYAQAVIDEALTSKDERLLKYAAYISERLVSARVAATRPAPQSSHAPEATEGAAAAAETRPKTDDTEEELRSRVMDKYRRGLR